MRSGRHGAARPPIGVVFRRDRIEFLLHSMLILLSLVVVLFSGGWTNIAFWAAILIVFVSIALLVRRIDRLSRDELRSGELL